MHETIRGARAMEYLRDAQRPCVRRDTDVCALCRHDNEKKDKDGEGEGRRRKREGKMGGLNRGENWDAAAVKPLTQLWTLFSVLSQKLDKIFQKLSFFFYRCISDEYEKGEKKVGRSKGEE